MVNGRICLHTSVGGNGYPAKHDTWEGASNIPAVIMDQYTRARLLASRQDMTMRHKSSHVDLESIYSYKGVDVMTCIGEEQYVIDGIKQYARDVIAGLKERFSAGSGQVLFVFDIFQFESMPTDRKSWLDCREMFGVLDLPVLNSHYYPCLSNHLEGVCKQRRCHQQWRILRKCMWETKENDLKSDKTSCAADFCADWLNTSSPNNDDEIRGLAQIFCVIVLSSVPNERVFSSMNRTKTIERSRIWTDVFKFNDLMMIKSNGSDCAESSDERWKDIVDRAFVCEWHRRKNKYPSRSRSDVQPEQQKKPQDIKTRISMPK